jgi:hypothetical protein
MFVVREKYLAGNREETDDALVGVREVRETEATKERSNYRKLITYA